MTQRILTSKSKFVPWFVLLAAILLLVSLAAFTSAAGSWAATGAVTNGYMSQAQSLLADGRILVAGGPGMFANSATEYSTPPPMRGPPPAT